MKDEQRVQKFLQEFSLKLAKEFGEDLDFILLFGSAARGEWKRGISDVDLIIQAKKQETVEDIKREAERIFWELDEKHDTQFKKVCSTAKEKNHIERIFSVAKLYVPFEVFGPGDIDWQEGRVKRKDLLIGAELVAPQAILFKRMKYEGKILYGRDIRKVIQVKVSWWEKIKALLVPLHLASISVLMALLFPKIALKIANKSVIYSIGSTLFFLDKSITKSLGKSAQKLEREIKKKGKFRTFRNLELDFLLNFDYQKLFNFDFAYEAIRIKYNWQEWHERFNRWETLKFCWRSIFFVNAISWYAILRADRHRIILKTLVALRTILLFLIIWLLFYYLGRFL